MSTDSAPLQIVVISHYFPPEIGAPQARLSEMARMWADAGDSVTVLTGMPNHPTGIIPPEYKGRATADEIVDGYRVRRTWLYATPNSGFAKKILGHLTFMVSSVVLGRKKLGRPDVIVVSSPTFFSIFSAWFLARVKRSAMIVEVRDLWPAIFVELGVLTNPVLIRLLERLELAAYHAADHVVVVSEGFRDDLIERGVPAEKVTTITNGADLDRFQVVEPDPADRTWLGATEDDVLVLYIGAHGISHGSTPWQKRVLASMAIVFTWPSLAKVPRNPNLSTRCANWASTTSVCTTGCRANAFPRCSQLPTSASFRYAT